VTAAEILSAIRLAYPKCAVVREVSIVDLLHERRNRASKRVRRIDALLRDTSGYTAIEIKVTRADFRRDTEEKRRAWKAHTRRFIYATPAGLVTPGEVPDGCGLWEFDGHRLKVIKKATINKSPLTLPRSVFDTMLYRVSNYERAA
jgi:hypothetical protein